MLETIPRPIRVATYLYKFKDIAFTKKHLCANPTKAETAYPVHIYHLNQNKLGQSSGLNTMDTIARANEQRVTVAPKAKSLPFAAATPMIVGDDQQEAAAWRTQRPGASPRPPRR